MQMNSKKYVALQLSIVAVILLVFALLNYSIDPLFHFRRPCFGMSPVVKKQRYQNAGMARHFDFDSAVVGNSLAENIRKKDLQAVLGKKTIRLTAPGSYPLDWKLTLDILKHRRIRPKKVMMNLDPFVFIASPTRYRHTWPLYLYDRNPFNDVYYLLNFDITWDFTMNTLEKNLKRKIPSSEKIYVWDDICTYGRKSILAEIKRQPLVSKKVDADVYIANAVKNARLLSDFFVDMPETTFIFFCSPFSILYWDNCMRDGTFDACRKSYYAVFEFLLKYPNVRIYFWSDDKLLQSICNLDYYRDEAHFDTRLAHMLCERIGRDEGRMTPANYQEKLGKYFSFLEKYDYDTIWK